MIGNQIKDYKIISLLGEGGMANVYLAQHQSLGNNVALKLLKEEYVQHPNIRKRFLAEARSLAQMSHPNIIKVTDLIDAGDIVAFVMEYIEGQTLEEFLNKKGELTRTEIESFFNQMILAVEYVHSQGLIHRDIKPSNFMVTKSGQIKLLDFGIAKNTNEGAVDYTKTGLMQQMGTPLYMSPEQVKNTAEVTKQTDIYSLGVVLWQLVMNKKPYNSVEFSLPEIQVSILKEPLPLTHTIWDSTIQQATEKDPTKRFLKINSKKGVESKSVSDTEIDPAIPKQKPKNVEQVRITYFNFKTISIGIGILLFVGILIINLSKDGTADKSVATIPDDSSNEIVVPTETADGTVSKEEEPKQLPNEKTTDKNQQEDKIEGTYVLSNKLKIGQKHQGGIIFYIDNLGKHGKICSIQSLGEFDWKEAKYVCESLSLNEYSDWYLPSRDDLSILCSNKKLVPNMQRLSIWSSTVNVLDENYVWGDDFNYCSQEIWHISNNASTFAVRKF
jgi:serine/threonine protein kinase